MCLAKSFAIEWELLSEDISLHVTIYTNSTYVHTYELLATHHTNKGMKDEKTLYLLSSMALRADTAMTIRRGLPLVVGLSVHLSHSGQTVIMTGESMQPVARWLLTSSNEERETW